MANSDISHAFFFDAILGDKNFTAVKILTRCSEILNTLQWNILFIKNSNLTDMRFFMDFFHRIYVIFALALMRGKS